MSEFEVIDAFVAALGGTAPVPGVRLGTGDDAASLATDEWPIVAIDTLAEGIHWDPRYSDPTDVGFKLLSVNLSDMAAMGATPGPFLVSLALAERLSEDRVTQLAQGIASARTHHELDEEIVRPIGGDLTRCRGGDVLTLVLFGRPVGDRLLRRDRARAGDRLWVSGALGRSEAGLAALRAQRGQDPRFATLIGHHRRPMARVALGAALARLEGVHAAIDISDGIASDLRHILEASGVGARLRTTAIPIDSATRELAAELDLDPLELALTGGEDYQLLCAADSRCSPDLEALGLIPVGDVVAERGLNYYDSAGQWAPLLAKGYVHR